MAIFKKPSLRSHNQTPTSPTSTTSPTRHPHPSPARRSRRKGGHLSKSPHSPVHLSSLRYLLRGTKSNDPSSRPRDGGDENKPQSLPASRETLYAPTSSKTKGSLTPKAVISRRSRTLSGKLERLRTKFRNHNQPAGAASDQLPFALQAQTMLPLSVAAQRDDIRLREEGFEMSGSTQQPLMSASPHCITFPNSLENSVPVKSSSSLNVTREPSFHFQEPSSIQLTGGDEDHISKPTSMMPNGSNANHSLGKLIGVTASLGELGGFGEDLDPLEEDSFNEESFLRMAAAELGW